MTKNIKILLFLTVAATSTAFAQAPDGYDDGIYHKWEIKIDAAPSIASRSDQNEGYGLTDYDESIGADLGVGYNFTSNWYAGLSSGFWFHWGGETNKMIPLLADVVWRWNLGTSERFSLFLQGRTGYLFGLEKDLDYFKGLPDFKETRMKLVTENDPEEVLRLLDHISSRWGDFNPSDTSGVYGI